jgi:putative SOS response-associated peptidase YedK
VAPTDSLPVVRYDAKAAQRSLDMLRWGLIPYWAKDIKVGVANINAKAEGIESKPAFGKAFERRRCLVPVDNFYEWKKTESGKQPYAIALADRGIMALAGLWENWRSPAGEWVRSFAIITTTPHELCAELHNRMPVVLKPEGWPAWLGEQPATDHDLKTLLAPYPSDDMICWPVSARVGNVRNNDSSLIEPVAAAQTPGKSINLDDHYVMLLDGFGTIKLPPCSTSRKPRPPPAGVFYLGEGDAPAHASRPRPVCRKSGRRSSEFAGAIHMPAGPFRPI